MAYRKPPLFARQVFNRLAMKFGISGSETLVVRGRRTGSDHRVPVIPVELQSTRYLVSPRGEADWARNLRAAGQGELRSKGTTQQFQATEVPVAERGPILTVYQKAAGGRGVPFQGAPRPRRPPRLPHRITLRTEPSLDLSLTTSSAPSDRTQAR